MRYRKTLLSRVRVCQLGKREDRGTEISSSSQVSPPGAINATAAQNKLPLHGVQYSWQGHRAREPGRPELLSSPEWPMSSPRLWFKDPILLHLKGKRRLLSPNPGWMLLEPWCTVDLWRALGHCGPVEVILQGSGRRCLTTVGMSQQPGRARGGWRDLSQLFQRTAHSGSKDCCRADARIL